jgi:hypothetical protein
MGKKNTGRIDMLKIVAELRNYDVKIIGKSNIMDQVINIYN